MHVKNSDIFKVADWDWNDYYPYFAVLFKRPSLLSIDKMDGQFVVYCGNCMDSIY